MGSVHFGLTLCEGGVRTDTITIIFMHGFSLPLQSGVNIQVYLFRPSFASVLGPWIPFLGNVCFPSRFRAFRTPAPCPPPLPNCTALSLQKRSLSYGGSHYFRRGCHFYSRFCDTHIRGRGPPKSLFIIVFVLGFSLLFKKV